MIDEDWVLKVSSSLGVLIEPSRLKDVTMQLQRIEQVAKALDGVELDPATDEMAPVWRP